MRTKRKGALVAALAIIVVASAAIASGLISLGPTVHQDGAGPLGSALTPTSGTVSAFDRGQTGPWTLGFELCLAQAGGPAVIRSVTPTKAVGSGFTILGTLIRTFTPSQQDTPIISLNGFPPTLPDGLSPAVGAAISTQCSEGVAGEPYTELLIGFAGHGSDGGGWRGISVGYSFGGRDYVVQLESDILSCGAAVDSEPACHPPSSGPTVSP